MKRLAAILALCCTAYAGGPPSATLLLTGENGGLYTMRLDAIENYAAAGVQGFIEFRDMEFVDGSLNSSPFGFHLIQPTDSFSGYEGYVVFACGVLPGQQQPVTKPCDIGTLQFRITGNDPWAGWSRVAPGCQLSDSSGQPIPEGSLSLISE